MRRLISLLSLCFSLLTYGQKRVGIGTSSPAQRLSIDSTVNIDQGNFDDGGGKPSLRFGDAATGEAIGSRRISGGNNPFGLDFWTGNNKRMVISNAGNVGIGADVPTAALSVNGDILVDFNSTNNGVTGYSLRFGNASSGEGIASARSGSINLNGLNLFTNLTPRLSITNNGKVGIGTTNPLAALHTIGISGDQIITYAEGNNTNFASSYISGSAASSYVGTAMLRQSTVRGYVGINPTNDLILARVEPLYGLHTALTVINSTGNIGIGTSSPAQRLSIDSTLNIDQGNYDDGGKPSLRFGDGSTGEAIGSRRTAGGTNPYGLDFYTGNTKKMSITNGGFVGIGTSNPAFRFEVSDDSPNPVFIHSSSSTQTLVNIGSDAAAPNYVGTCYYKTGAPKAYTVVDGSNNFILSTSSSAAPHLVINPSGNIGIGTSSPGFPLNFANSIGEKIAFYQNSGNNYGIGLQNLLLQLHTDVAGADIAFGYGSSASFNETMRIKGTGNLSVKGDIITDINGTNNGFTSPGLRFGASNSGEAISSKRTAGGNQNGLDFYTNGAARISVDNSGLVGINGNTTPGARLQINQTGNYNTSEGSTHAFEIWDNNETLYMGADGGNTISYIQAVGNSTFHTLALQARGGNVAIGKSSATEKIDVNGNGAFSGNVSVQSGKGIVRNYTGTQLKTEMIPFTFPGLVTLNAGNTTTLSVTFPEAYTAAPMVYVAGLVPSSGSAGYLECVYNVVSISTSGFTLSIYNPRSTGATFNNGSPNFAINFVATGAQ